MSEFPDEHPLARVTLLEDPDTLLADETILILANWEATVTVLVTHRR